MKLSSHDLGDLILFHRKKSGLSRIELARFAGIGKTAIYDVEHGKLTVQLETLMKIFNVLNISIHLESPFMNMYETLHRKAKIFVNGEFAGILIEIEKGRSYQFEYNENYHGDPVSMTMPIKEKRFKYSQFPPFFEGLLPEGMQLDALLKIGKIDSDDYLEQLIRVGGDLVGNVTVKGME